MICPNCDNKIPDTALRCKYCRKPIKSMVPVGRVSGKAGIFSRAGRLLNVFLKKGKGREKVPWSFLDVAVFTIMVYILICNDFFGAGSGIIQLLRSNYLIFTRDNRLFYYMAVCVNTMVLKVFCVLFIAILAVIRRTRFSSTLISGGTMPAAWGTWMLPLYISICFALRAFVLNGPLTANIPFNSVFPGAKILGNIFLIFSIIFVAPFVEEIIFRGFIYPAFNRYMGIFPAIILTSIIFTASHFPQIRFDYVFIIVLFLLSGIITYTRAMTGSTRIAIIMHIIYNSVAIAVGYFDYVIFRI